MLLFSRVFDLLDAIFVLYENRETYEKMPRENKNMYSSYCFKGFTTENIDLVTSLIKQIYIYKIHKGNYRELKG